MQRGATLSWGSLHTWLSVLLFPFSSYTCMVEGNSGLCWEAEPFFLQNNPKTGKLAALIHRQLHLRAGPWWLVPRGPPLAMLGYR